MGKDTDKEDLLLRNLQAEHIYNRQRDLIYEFTKALREFFKRETGMEPRLASHYQQRREDGSITFQMEAFTEHSGTVMLSCMVTPDDGHTFEGL